MPVVGSARSLQGTRWGSGFLILRQLIWQHAREHGGVKQHWLRKGGQMGGHEIAVGVVGLIHQPVQQGQDVAGVLSYQPESGVAVSHCVSFKTKRAKLTHGHQRGGQALEGIAVEDGIS